MKTRVIWSEISDAIRSTTIPPNTPTVPMRPSGPSPGRLGLRQFPYVGWTDASVDMRLPASFAWTGPWGG